jgi:hypothetical protein
MICLLILMSLNPLLMKNNDIENSNSNVYWLRHLLPLDAVRTCWCILNTSCSDILKFLNLLKKCHNSSRLQEGNMKNQREHTVHQLANELSRLGKLSGNEWISGARYEKPQQMHGFLKLELCQMGLKSQSF